MKSRSLISCFLLNNMHQHNNGSVDSIGVLSHFLSNIPLVEESNRKLDPGSVVSKDTNPPPLLPYFSNGCPPMLHPKCMRWYSWWLNKQIKHEPQETFSCLPGFQNQWANGANESFVALWQEVHRLMTTDTYVSIDELILRLNKNDALLLSSDAAALTTARNLIFTVIGWQTMLYRSDLGSCPRIQLAIADDMDGHQGQANMCLKQSHACCKKSMHDFLLGFGVLLPPRNFAALEIAENKQAFKEIRVADIASCNAYLLTSIGGLNIKWIDSLACHMDLDRDSSTLFLFRYPSFCAANICSEKGNALHKSVIHACAAPYSSGQWATEDDVEQMLHETLLTYRLLFGQSKAGRRLFRKLKPFEQILEAGQDKFLTIICGQEVYEGNPKLRERMIYDLPRDFPVYRSRLAVLISHLNARKPRSWKELWQDKRDSASWLTFWVVLLFGGVGILLALLQVILQIVQLRTQRT